MTTNTTAETTPNDEKTQDLEKLLQNLEAARQKMWHLEETHQAERRLLEERQKEEMKVEELHIQELLSKYHTLTARLEEQDETPSAPPALEEEEASSTMMDVVPAHRGEKRHFREERYGIHRYY